MANTLEGPRNRERRAARRFDLSLAIEIHTAIEQARVLRGTTRDLSSRGVYFVIDQGLAPGSELDLTLTLPAAMTAGTDVFVQARGRVVRTEPRTEEGTERVGIGAIIEAYDFVRAEPTPA